MENGEPSGSGSQKNWPVILSGAVGAGVGVALGPWLVGLADLGGFWPGVIGAGVGAGVGVILGQLVGSLVFRQSPRSGPRT